MIDDDYGINDDGYSGMITGLDSQAIDNNVPFTLQDDSDTNNVTPKHS